MVHKKAEDMQVPDALSRCENVKADVVGSPVEDNPIVQCLKILSLCLRGLKTEIKVRRWGGTFDIDIFVHLHFELDNKIIRLSLDCPF